MPSDVELYQRTYSTLLRSRGETKLRILESSHIAIESSLHPFAGAEDLDLGAFLYATQRLPASIYQGRVVIMGQEAEQFAAVDLPLADWPTSEAPARRRQWHAGPAGQWGVLLSSTSDVDDLSRPSSPTRSSGTSCGASYARSAGRGRRGSPVPPSARASSAARSTTGSASRKPGAPRSPAASARSPRPTCASASGCSAAPRSPTRV